MRLPDDYEDHGGGLIVDGEEDEVGTGSLRGGELNGEVGGGIAGKGAPPADGAALVARSHPQRIADDL